MLAERILKRVAARLARNARASWPKLIVAAVVLLALPALAYWRGLGVEQSDVGANSSEMVVETLEQNTARVNVVLKEKSGPRRLVINIGVPEALSIAGDLNLSNNVPAVTAYSMSNSMVSSLGGKVQRVVVNDATDRGFFAKVVLSADNREVVVDAAPSDAIALAVRTKTPIFVDANVLAKAGVVPGR
jgi:uncharacterized protein